MVRIVLVLLGLGAIGAGGYFGWLHQDQLPQLLAFDPSSLPYELLAAGGTGLLGLILLLCGVLIRTTSKEQREAEAARRAEAIRAADDYYSRRARDPDRDWRRDGLPPESTAPAPEPAPEPARAPRPAPAPMAPPQEAAPSPSTAAPSIPFPAPMPQQPIPTVQAAPPEPAPSPTAPSASAATSAATGDPSALFPDIRKALADKRLDDADRLLNEQRTRLQNAGDAESLALAELTSLAGDHAAASGRTGGAKWLWRLALQRYGAANALNSPSARAVSERLRLSDQ